MVVSELFMEVGLNAAVPITLPVVDGTTVATCSIATTIASVCVPVMPVFLGALYVSWVGAGTWSFCKRKYIRQKNAWHDVPAFVLDVCSNVVACDDGWFR